MKIVISCSAKYPDLIEKALEVFKDRGDIEISFPNFESLKTGGEVGSVEEKKKLAQDHYKEIDTADAVYFIVPDGYMGTSCKLELGYSKGRNKRIFFSELTGDAALDWYAEKIIPIEKLADSF